MFPKDKHTRAQETGRTMTEMISVLAIIGVLSVGGIMFGGYAVDRIKANRVVSGLQERILLAQKRRIIGQSITFRDRRIQESIMSLYPVQYQKGVTDETIPIYYGKKITVSEIPQQVCEALKDDETLKGTLSEVRGIVSFNNGGEDGACKEENNEFFVLFGGRSEGKCRGVNNGCLECDEISGEWVIDEAKDGEQIHDICHKCSNGHVVAKEKGKVVPCGNECCAMFETCDAEQGCVTQCPANSSYNNFSGDQIGDSDCYCNEGYRVDAFQTGCIYSPTCTDEECSSENECMSCNPENGACENMCQSVEYLESTGTQWMDTGINITTTDNFTANYVVTLEKKYIRGLIGYSGTNHGYWGITTNGYYELGYYSTGILATEGDSVVFKRTIDSTGKQSHELYINGVLASTLSRATAETGKFSLWAIANGEHRASGKIYSFQMELNGENVLDFVPVLAPDETPCMFDKISQKLFCNSGSGTFKTNLD